MHTEFNITTTDASVKNKYTVKLGADILMGQSPEAIRELARRCAIIDLQNNTKLGLRSAEDLSELRNKLVDQYPNVEVLPFTSTSKPKKELTTEELIAALKAKGLDADTILSLV